MNLRKLGFFLKVVVYFLTIYLAVFVMAYVVVDPYGVSGTRFIWNEKKFASHNTLVPFRLAETLRERTSDLVFGNSRSGKISPAMTGRPLLNFSNSIYGRPVDIVHFLSHLDEAQIKNIDRVFFLLDIEFDRTSERVVELNFNDGKGHLLEALSSLNFSLLRHSLKTLQHNLGQVWERSTINEFHRDGYAIGHHETPHVFSSEEYGTLDDQLFDFDEASLASLKKVDEFCESRGIEVFFYFPAINDAYLSKINLKSFATFQAKVLETIGGFYDLTHLPGLSNDLTRSVDFHHLDSQAVATSLKHLDESMYVDSRNKMEANFQTYQSIRQHVISNVFSLP